MTAKETILWMKAKGYYKRWILPELGLHSDDPELTSYLHRPVGNSPEMMPRDASLNQDVHACVGRHAVITKDYLADEKKSISAHPNVLHTHIVESWKYAPHVPELHMM
jgi:hypothetical protein